MATAKCFIMWWPGTGLNRRRRPFQGRALPLSYLASVQTSLQIPVRDPVQTGKGGVPRTVCCNYPVSISTPLGCAKPLEPAADGGSHSQAAGRGARFHILSVPHPAPYTGWHLCDVQFLVMPALRLHFRPLSARA